MGCFPSRYRVQSKGYFTEYTPLKGCFYLSVILFLVSVGIIVVIEPFIPVKCPAGTTMNRSGRVFSNPDYDSSDCSNIVRFPQLLWLNRVECDHGRRTLFSVFVGGVIGWERRSADRPAGIRTMALVSLGSCVFTLTSMNAFLTGPMSWDASRVTAAIPSGVGFLGAGMIWKQSVESADGGSSQTVHGLTTAASLWLSAAVGIAAGGGMYFTCMFCLAIMVVLLRFGPRVTDEDVDPMEDVINVDDPFNDRRTAGNGGSHSVGGLSLGPYGACVGDDASPGKILSKDSKRQSMNRASSNKSFNSGPRLV